MTTATPASGDYDYAAEYASYVAWREQSGPEADPFGLLPILLDLLGGIYGRRVLDAGCGEGYLARALAARGAHVTGTDLSSRLISLARARDPDGRIDYQVADLSQPLPAVAGRFDAAGSYLVLNDVLNYRGFAATIAASLAPGGRLVLALNNPTAPSPTTSTPVRSAATAAYGKRASGPTIITGRWRTTSTRSTPAVSASPS